MHASGCPAGPSLSLACSLHACTCVYTNWQAVLLLTVSCGCDCGNDGIGWSDLSIAVCIVCVWGGVRVRVREVWGEFVRSVGAWGVGWT